MLFFLSKKVELLVSEPELPLPLPTHSSLIGAVSCRPASEAGDSFVLDSLADSDTSEGMVLDAPSGHNEDWMLIDNEAGEELHEIGLMYLSFKQVQNYA